MSGRPAKVISRCPADGIYLASIIPVGVWSDLPCLNSLVSPPIINEWLNTACRSKAHSVLIGRSQRGRLPPRDGSAGSASKNAIQYFSLQEITSDCISIIIVLICKRRIDVNCCCFSTRGTKMDSGVRPCRTSQQACSSAFAPTLEDHYAKDQGI